jgi:nitrite reductase/ring-hydroxylating ferredoxin subunit
MTAQSLTDRLENLDRLDPAVGRLQKVVGLLPPGRVKDTLHGVSLGHPLHPMLAQGALGAFVSCGVLDATGRHDDAARLLIATGLVASLPAAAAGAVDWTEQHEQQTRVGLVHAAGNSIALGCYAASLVARRRGHRGLGRALGFVGLTVAGGSAYLGGHLAFRQAAGANHAESVPHLVAPGWHRLGLLSKIPQHEPVKRHIGDVPVLVVRDGEHVDVLADACPHLAAPLSDGKLTDDGCIVCPWHGSSFRLKDGGVVHGPATTPAPRFRTRITDGVLEACLPGAG